MLQEKNAVAKKNKLCPSTIVTQVSERGIEVIADESGPTSFNSGGLGWNFTNVLATSADKFNWYDFINFLAPNPADTFSTLKLEWARVTIKFGSSQFPFFNVYSQRLNDGKDAGSFYRSRATYEINPLDVLYDQQVILYVGQDPVKYYKDLPHIQMHLTNFIGPVGQTNFLPGEVIIFLSLQSNSAAPTGAVNVTVFTLGHEIASSCEQLQLQTVLL